MAGIHRERQSRGLSRLELDDRLIAAARAHSQDMAQEGFFGHVGSDGSEPGDRILAQGYRWTFYAENVGCGYSSPAEMVQGWMESQGHRENILSVQAEHVGVGVVRREGTRCSTYWTAVFAAGG